jgi:exonuclease III
LEYPSRWGQRILRIADTIALHSPDIIVFSEFRAASGTELRHLLAARGYAYMSAPVLAARQNGVAIVSRWAVAPAVDDPPIGIPSSRWHEVTLPSIDLVVAGFYGALENEPYNDWWLSVRAAARKRLHRPFLLAGDFNTGQSIIDAPRDPFYCAEHFDALQDLGLVDAWRTKNASAREYSWYSRRGGKDLNGFRLDHVLVSPVLATRIVAAKYLHSDREAGTSDHSALLVEFH